MGVYGLTGVSTDQSWQSPDQLEASPDGSGGGYGLTVDGKGRLGGFNGRFVGGCGPIGGFPRSIRGRPPTHRRAALPLGSGSLRTVISDGPITTGSRRLDFQEMEKPRFSTAGKSAETWNDQTPAEKQRILEMHRELL